MQHPDRSTVRRALLALAIPFAARTLDFPRLT